MITHCEPCRDVTFEVSGWLGERLRANLDQWLLVAPMANPGMIEKLRMREISDQDALVVWYGEFIGKYLTASAACERAMPSSALCRLVKEIIDILAEVQGEDGYLGPFCRQLRVMGAPEKRKWDIWGHYHLILGLVAWHELYGWEQPLQMAVRIADYFAGYFLEGQADILDADCSEMNTAMIHAMGVLYEKTGNPAYLRFMRMVESRWDDPRAGGYITDTLAGKAFYQLRRPRWESLHPIQGILSLYEATGEVQYRQAFEQLWHSIRAFDVHNTGGFSSGEQACGDPYDPGAIETCCSVAWSALSVDMLRLTGAPEVADALEKTLFNAILGAQSPSGRWFTYNTPMDGERRASAHDIVFQAIAGSPELNCCSVNGPRALGMVTDWALMRQEGALVLNYLGPCRYTLPNGTVLTVETRYPLDAQIQISADGPLPGALRIRIPAWSKENRAALDGGQALCAQPGRYVALPEELEAGWTLRLSLDFTLRREMGEGACSGKMCLYRGPLLLAEDEAYTEKRLEDAGPMPAGIDEAAQLPTGQPHRLVQPALLLRLAGADGSERVVCDFASAGMQGGRYRSWIPCQ